MRQWGNGAMGQWGSGNELKAATNLNLGPPEPTSL